MKNVKLLPFIGLVAMLSACTLSNANGKLPQMKKFSNEVSFDTWTEHLNAASKEEEQEGEGEEQGVDLVCNFKIGRKITEKRTIKDQNRGDASTNMVMSINSKYDADTNVGYAEMKVDGSSKETYGEGSSLSYSATGSLARYYQTATIEDEEKVVSVDKKNKLYFLQNDDVQSSTMGMAIMPAMLFAMMPMAYDGTEDEDEKAKYHFYEDGGVFTVQYVSTTETTESGYIDGESKVYCNITKVETSIAQAEYKKNNGKVSSMTVRYEQKEELTKNYVENYSSYVNGEVRATSEDSVMVATIAPKKVDLKAIDLNGFIDGGEDVEIGLSD